MFCLCMKIRSRLAAINAVIVRPTNTNGEILCIIIGLMYLCTSLFGKEGFGLGKWGQLYTR